MLIQVLYLSLDPYMRGRMSEEKSYADPVPIGGVITAESAGVVIESRSLRFSKGDYVCCPSGWQSHFIGEESDLMIYPVDPARVSLSAYLGVCGMPGRTAYFGLLREAKPQRAKPWLYRPHPALSVRWSARSRKWKHYASSVSPAATGEMRLGERRTRL